MAKIWVVTLQPSDLSASARLVENINGRKKIGMVENRLCSLYGELVPNNDLALQDYIIRGSGTLTSLTKPPYLLRAKLEEV